MRALGLALGLLAAGGTAADSARTPEGMMAAAITEAAARFGLSEDLLRRVMARESGFDPAAVSPKGALGLMQLMPATWTEMRVALGLGDDPFDVRDNILAGAGYLRRMRDRFGLAGGLAAYNAGPGRYAAVRDGRAVLPAETRRYLAALTQGEGAVDARPADPRRAPLAPPDGSALFPLRKGEAQ